MDFRTGQASPSMTSATLHSLTSSSTLIPPSSPHPGLFYYPGLAVAGKPPPAPSPLSSTSLAANKTLSSSSHRSTAAVPPVPHSLQPSYPAHLSLVTPGSSAVVSSPSGTSRNNGSSSSFAAALRHLAKQASGPSTGTAAPHVTPSNSDTENETLKSPNRSYGSSGSSSSGYSYLSSAGNMTPAEVGSSRTNGSHTTKSSSPNENSRTAALSSSKLANGQRSENVVVEMNKTSQTGHEGPTSATITRAKSPPIVTIAPTLSLTGPYYQDSRKAYDRPSLCHTVPSSVSFSGGLSTGLAGLTTGPLGMPSSLNLGLSASSSLNSTGIPYSTSSMINSIAGTDYIRQQDLHPPPFHTLPSFNPFPHPRPEELFYNGLRSIIPTSSSHFQTEDNPLSMIPPHTMPTAINNSYHESMLAQLPSSRSSTLLPHRQEDYLLNSRNSNFNPYSIPPVPLDPSSLHPALYHHSLMSSTHPYRLEEQLYLERYGLLRPSLSLPPQAGIPPYPSLPLPPYLGFRYPSALLSAESNLNNGLEAHMNRLKQEEEQRLKDRLRDEERLTTPVPSGKSQEINVSSRPLATVPPRESSSHHRSQERRDRERLKEKEKRRDKENEMESKVDSQQSSNAVKSNRKITVQLPSESSSARGAKVHAVPPLYSNVVNENLCNDANPEVSIRIDGIIDRLPATSASELKVSNEFSYSALEAMAMLKQRIPSPVNMSVAPAISENIKEKQSSESVPLDLSESLAQQTSTHSSSDQLRSVISDQPRLCSPIIDKSMPSVHSDQSIPVDLSGEPCGLPHDQTIAENIPSEQLARPASSPPQSHQIEQEMQQTVATPQPVMNVASQDSEEPVRSLLDVRGEKWKSKREKNHKSSEGLDNASDIEDFDDVDDEVSWLNGQVSSSAECGIPRIPEEDPGKQQNFLNMFGLVTPQQRNDYELSKCMKRQNVLREPTPTAIDSEEEDSATCLLRDLTTFSASQCNTTNAVSTKDLAKCNFFRNLDLYPADQKIRKDVEHSWNAVVADRMKRHFGKRSWEEAFSPAGFAAEVESSEKQYGIDKSQVYRPLETNKPKEIPKLAVPPKNGIACHSVKPSEFHSISNLAKLELAEKPNDWCHEASKLTSEVTFWLRHLTIPMARTLTSNNVSMKDVVPPLENGGIKSNGNVTKEESVSDSINESDSLDRWPGIDTVMVLYMNHQQELATETKFLRDHCERLHVQLAEGQASLSKLCLTLSSLVETQRKYKEEENSMLQSIHQLQTIFKLLSPHKL